MKQNITQIALNKFTQKGRATALAPKGSALLRYSVCVFIILASTPLFYFFSITLVSQLHVLVAERYTANGFYGLALARFEKARDYQPGSWEIWRQLALLHFQLAEEGPSKIAQFTELSKAREAIARAYQLNSLNDQIAFDRAIIEYQLEQLFPYIPTNLRHGPFDALPYFNKAIQLKPNSVMYRYTAARYFFVRNKTRELLDTIRFLGSIYPESLRRLKKEAFWSPTCREAFKQGVVQAIDKGITPRQSYGAMALVLQDEQAWAKAIAFLEKAMSCTGGYNQPADYIHLGELYLRNNEPSKASPLFMKAIRISGSTQDVLRVCRVYRSLGYTTELVRLARDLARDIPLSSRMQLIIARCLFEGKLFDEAEDLLRQVIKTHPCAEAYHMLGLVALRQGNPDEAELSMHRATLFEPSNMRYRRELVRLLKRLGKIESAERELGVAIQYSEAPSPGLFRERAYLRQKLKDYEGALKDLETVIKLTERKGPVYAQAAEVLLKLGSWEKATAYYQRAVALEPNNKKYTKRYLELKGGSS